jgi:GNAT superfamily N-acetyltransferase
MTGDRLGCGRFRAIPNLTTEMPTPEFEIRAATRHDAAEVAAMEREMVAYFDEVVPPRPEEGPTPPFFGEAEILAHGFGERRWFELLIAERGDRALGCLMYHYGYWAEDPAPCLYIAGLFVRAEARRQGVGQALMAAGAELLADVGGKRLIWSVWVRNPAAMAFYESLGGEYLDEERFMCWREPNWPR